MAKSSECPAISEDIAKDQFKCLKSLFRRLLKGWKVKYKPAWATGERACCEISVSRKEAYIHQFGKDKVPETYMLHEFLHIGLAAIKDRKDREEFIRAVCGYVEATIVSVMCE